MTELVDVGSLAAVVAEAADPLERELGSLLAIAAIAALAPLLVGLLRLKVAEVVVLIGLGVVAGPELLGLIEPDDAILLLSNLGLGFLFFLAGYEIDQDALRGEPGRLGLIGWLVSFGLAIVVVGTLDLVGIAQTFAATAIALSSTALGTLLPVLRDQGQVGTPFGRLFLGAGAFGEFGPVLAMSVLLGAQGKLAAIISLVLFGLVALLLSWVPERIRNRRIEGVITQGDETSSQTPVRLTVLLLVALLALAGGFGLDVVLGAFLAGMIFRRYAPDGPEATLRTKIEALAFGFFIPLFFVVSGATLDIRSIIDNPVPLVIAFVLLLLLRGAPQLLVYRRAIPDPLRRLQLSLLIATGLPIIVAVTSVAVGSGAMTSGNAAALVGAGALTVLVLPLASDVVGRRADARQARAEATA
ncbi:MAG: cation:proton antiporter [Candidatus Nanopelagicales bacterium]